MPRRKSVPEKKPEADATQKIPLVTGVPGEPADGASEVTQAHEVQPTEPHDVQRTAAFEERAPEHTEPEQEETQPPNGNEQPPGVPQETVPMPLPAWPPVETKSVGEAPQKPPPLMRRGPEFVEAKDSGERQPWVAQRTGILTGELRRALPPWALPLLSSQPVSVWIGARVGLTILAFLAGLMIPGMVPRGTANWYGSPGGPVLTGFVDRVGGVWTRWDGQWYLKIATEGYKRDDGSAAFFPLYPWLVEITGWLAQERYIWAGIVVSSAFFLGALILLHRLIRIDFHPADAGRTVFYLAAFPMAFFFWAIYSESLFLFLSVGAMLAMRSQRWGWAALCTSLAVWTRTTGLLLLLPLAWELWQAYHPPMPTNPYAMPPARPSRFATISLAVPVLSFFALLIWTWIMFGDPLASLSAQTGWNRQFSWPWQTIGNAVQAAVSMPFQFQQENQSWTYLASFIFAVIMGLLSLRWLRGSYSLYLWAGILFPLFSATRLNPLLSYPRFLIVLFPAFMALALVGRNRYAHQLILWSSLLLLALFTIRFANWFWVA